MLRLGLVQRVWPAATFADEWRAYAARLAAAPATSVRAAKANLRASSSRTLAQCLEAESAAQRACWDSGDAAEGIRAFAEKRAPRLCGRCLGGARNGAERRGATLRVTPGQRPSPGASVLGRVELPPSRFSISPTTSVSPAAMPVSARSASAHEAVSRAPARNTSSARMASCERPQPSIEAASHW